MSDDTGSAEVVVTTGDRKRFTLVVKTPEGDARITFRRLRHNEYMKYMIDAEKAIKAAKDDPENKSGRSWESMREEQDAVLSKIVSVENLLDDGEPVAVESLKAGEVSEDIVSAIVSGFWVAFWAEKRRSLETEAKEKNAQEKGEDSIKE